MKVGILALISCVAAVFREDAFKVDWKQSFIGKPLHVSEFEGRLAIVSDTNSLTCMTPEGFTSWRRTLSEDQLRSGVAIVGDTIVVGGDTLTAYDAVSGVPQWVKYFQATTVHSNGHEVIVNGEQTVNLTNGELLGHPSDLGSPLYVNGQSVVLSKGTLSWDEFGVLRLVSGEEETLIMRNEGLAHIKQALFVPIVPEGDFGSDLIVANAQLPPVEAFVYRITSHLSELWSLAKFILSHGPAMLVLPEPIKPQFEFDQTLVVLTEQGSVYGLNATNEGQVSWVYHDLNPIEIVADPEARGQFLVQSFDGVTYVVTGEGDILGVAEEEAVFPADAIEIDGSTVRSKLGWQLELPGKVVAHASKRQGDTSGSVVVPTPSGDVLYKYLQPFQTVFATSKDDVLVLTLVDAVTGRVLHTHAHLEIVEISEEWPLALAFGEYWFAYTFLTKDESQSMKLTMVELYESEELNTRVSATDVNVLNDTATPHAVMHTWVLPSRDQPVYAMTVSVSPFGAAQRELILALEHQIVALPKNTINALAPAPELEVPKSGHLSHVYGIEKATRLVAGRTNSEFTYYLAAIGENSDLFCSRVSPAGDVDRLGYWFPKVKLIVFVAVFSLAMVTLAPLARNKVLKVEWR